MSRPATRDPVSDSQRDEFLELLADGTTVIEAARTVGRGRRDFYRLRDTDNDFAQAWRDAYDEGTDLLEAEAERRAIHGVDEPRMIGYGENAELITVKKYSDTLLIFLLKARRPEKFRDNVKVEHGGGGTPVQVEVKHSVDDLARVASILADAGVVAAGSASDAASDEVSPG